MKKLKYLSFAFTILFTPFVPAQEKPIDKIVAVVGRNIVIQSEVESQYFQKP